MKIYTKTGDQGETSVIGGRVSKDDLRIETYGTIDECNSFVGLAIAALRKEGSTGTFDDVLLDLEIIQHELFDCGSDLAYVNPSASGYKVSESMVKSLEGSIDKYDAETPDITKFILPGGTEAASLMHVCRTVVRRSERLVVTLYKTTEINVEVLRYLNRLSDWFFTVARLVNHRAGVQDITYVRSADVFRKTK